MAEDVHKILIVEDDPASAKLLQRTLEKDGLQIVASARNVAEALVAANLHAPDLALLDIGLQGEMSGIELAETLTQQLGIGVIFVSAVHSEELFQAITESKALGFIGKPFEAFSLRAEIHLALRLLRSEQQVLRSRSEMFAIFRNLPQSVIITDLRERITYVNSAASKLLGLAQNDLIGRSIKPCFLSLLQYEDASPFQLPDFSEDDSTSFANLVLERNGMPFFVELTVTHFTSQTQGFVYIIRDITERTRQAQQINEVKERFRRLAENLPGMAYTAPVRATNPFSFTYVNSYIEIITGYKKEAFLEGELHFFELLHPDDRSKFPALLKKATEKDCKYDLQYRIRHADGTWRTLRDRGACIADGKHGSVFQSIAFDITESVTLLRDKERLSHRLESLRFALDKSAIVAITDAKGVIEYVNDLFCDISGYTREELIGNTHRLIRSHVHPRSYFQELWKTVLGGDVWKGEICNKRKNGTHYWVDSTLVPLKNEHGVPTKFVAIRFDITKRKAYEEEIRLLNKTLEERVEERTKQLEYINKEKDEILAITVHDMKNPLAGIMLTAGLVRKSLERKEVDKAVKFIERIETTVGQMSEIIGNMLKFSAIESGMLRLRIERCEVNELLSNIVGQYVNQAQRKSIALIADMPVEPIFALGDSLALTQVFDNLLSNAVKYTLHKTTVRVWVEQDITDEENPLVRIHFQDQGPGLTPDDLSKVFQKFQRLSARPTGGEHSNGLGLSIVKKLAESMDGSIEVKTELGKGSTFTFSVPAYVEEDEEEPPLPIST